MNEPGGKAKQDNVVEDSSSSGEWTFVDKSANIKDINNMIKEELKRQDLNETELPADDEEPEKSEQVDETQEEKDQKSEEEVEKAEEAGEKDAESDDVSVISDEEPDHTLLLDIQERRIEKLERSNQLRKRSEQPKDIVAMLNLRSLTTLFGYMTLAIVMLITFLSAILVFKMDLEKISKESRHKNVFGTFDELNSPSKFKENLENLHKVINSLGDFNHKVPEIHNLLNDLTKNVDNFVKVKVNHEHKFKHVSNKIELLAALYESYCTVYATLDPRDIIHKKSCEIPKVLDDMIYLEQSEYSDNYDAVRQIPEEERREFLNALTDDKREINKVAETLLSEFLKAFSNFATQIEEIKGLNLQSKQFITIINKESNYAKKENESSEKEEVAERSKGEVKNGWKKNKYENRDKDSSEEKKYNKREKYENHKKNNNNNNNNEKFKQKREYDDSRESHERDFDQKYKNKRNGDYEHKYEERKNRDAARQSYKKKNDYYEKKDRDVDYKNKKNKKDNDYERKFDGNKKVPDYDNKSDYEKNHHHHEFEYNGNKKEKYSREQNHKKYCESGHCDKRKYDDDDDDDDDYSEKNHQKDKYTRNAPADHFFYDESNNDDEREWKGVDWLTKRGSDREKQRKSDWYSARADSRQWARTEEEEEQHQHQQQYSSKPEHRHHHDHPKKLCRPKNPSKSKYWSNDNYNCE